MPAVTVDDVVALPRIGSLDPATTTGRPVVSVTTAPAGFEGEGFPVRRAFAGVDRSYLDPFIHMDQMGEVEYAPGEPKGTPWHPHRGFETVTYMIDGTFQHQDSIGGGGLISDGDTQWMTAGGGILHIEAPPEELVASGRALPRHPAVGQPAPGRQDDRTPLPGHRSVERRLLASPDGGALLRVIAGEVAGHAGPGSTHSPMAMVHATLAPGARVDLPWRPEFNALVYVLGGAGSVGARGAPGPDRPAGRVR